VPGNRTPAPIFEGEYSNRPSGPGWPIIGPAIGRIFGGIAGVLWPGEAGDGELTPEQQREGRERYEASREAEEDRRRWDLFEEQLRRIERDSAMEWPGTYEPGRQRFPKQAVEDMPDPFQVEARQPAPRPYSVPVPTPEIGPLPAPTPWPRGVSSTSPDPGGSASSQTIPAPSIPSPSTIPWPQIATAIGSLLGPNPLGRMPRSWQTVPDAIVSSIVSSIPGVSIPSAMPSGNPLTSINTGLLGSSPPFTPSAQQQSEDDRCRPKRKKARKCRARAGLRWVGGPKSGQMAGSRCYSFKGST
jgi:hypothetical protein